MTQKRKKTEASVITFKVDNNSLESKWLNAQNNRSQSLKYLIQLAKHQFGNKDLVAIGLKASLDNPELNLLENRSTTTTDSSSPVEKKEEPVSSSNDNFVVTHETEKEENTESFSNEDTQKISSSDNGTSKPKTSSNKRMLHRSKKIKPKANENKEKSYTDQLQNDDDIPPFVGLHD